MRGLDVVDVNPERNETVLFSRAVQRSEANTRFGFFSLYMLAVRFGSVRFDSETPHAKFLRVGSFILTVTEFQRLRSFLRITPNRTVASNRKNSPAIYQVLKRRNGWADGTLVIATNSITRKDTNEGNNRRRTEPCQYRFNEHQPPAGSARAVSCPPERVPTKARRIPPPQTIDAAVLTCGRASRCRRARYPPALAPRKVPRVRLGLRWGRVCWATLRHRR